MNLFGRKSFSLCWSYVNISKRHFTGIRPEILKKIKLIPSPTKYYNELMKEVSADDKGRFSLDASFLMLMAEKSKTPEDMAATVEAYYNFVGHRTKLDSCTVDKLIRRAIECKNPKATFDIIYNHNFLLYYPHPTVLEDVMKYYRENKLVEEGKEFFLGAFQRKLLKFNPGFFEQAIFLSNETGEHGLAITAYKSSRKASVRLSNEAFQAVLNSISEVLAKGEKKKIGITNSVIKNIGSYNLNAEDYLQLSLSQIGKPENAVRVFETFSEANVNLEEGSSLLGNTKSNQEYFRKIYVAVRGQRELYGRFSRALKNIQQKYANRAIDKELYTLIQDLDKKANQADASSEAPKAEEVAEKASE